MTEVEESAVTSELGGRIRKPSQRNTKQAAVLRGSIAHLLPVLVGFPFVLDGRLGLSMGQWSLACAAVVAVWGGLWLALSVGWDRFLTFDPHYLLTPAAFSAPLIGLYIFLVPELRYLLLHGWYAVLLFGAGLVGFHAALCLHSIMTTTYIGVVWLLIQRGAPMTWSAELSATVLFFAMGAFCATILDRLGRQRREMKILRRQMLQLALTDRQTGLPNRRHLEAALSRQAEICRETGMPYSVALVDLDHFKEVNDSFGHEAGDKVLQSLSDIFRLVLRDTDLVGRLGGDEFAILMPDTDLDRAARGLERIRSVVASHGFAKVHGHRHRVTVSMGLIEARPQDTVEEVLKRADDRLYVAKRCGRNRLAMWAHGTATDTHATVSVERQRSLTVDPPVKHTGAVCTQAES